ncbi:hypothetical protein KC332_g4673 [Hortaea werneckii]|uniref:Kinase n=1 Tax=Hortaea werneckii TaxID=91943 RepID=A0A3M7IPL4_HORWE|nr:hypothetical protein KC358_g5372 [Hortaea werneckii]KAI6927992.1 hypothetical protein KC341_g11808 [Hortaea werneckii]KAI6937828.1 hypothetical protein KC348_g5627 [Hortaea werneckii]KAI6973510.1 hypothetical protein KC321_g5634 [Hortaea werneckii]KAI6990016.1 hypothetical protein KC329_g4819 [Hortaea werneckii]
MASSSKQLDASTLKSFENAAAGHEGVMSDATGEMLIKPCTDAEVNFYQQTLLEHPEFAELMPTFMGTLSLGAPAQAVDSTAAHDLLATSEAQKEERLHGSKIATETAIVLENLEHGFKQPNVLDLKLGARLYDPNSTAPEKAERLDKVASETTSGSLNFRIAGMKVWNGSSYDVYDKFYGRKFNADNVKDGFGTFFAGLTTGLKSDQAAELLDTIQAEIAKCRHVLERAESRMYSASLLIVYEGDASNLDSVMGGHEKAPSTQEKAPTIGEVQQSLEEEEEEDEPPTAFKVKMIDFAHATWTPGRGKDENVVKGIRNVEDQMDILISQVED